MGLVSILVPCYNAERWIAEAIESALGQTWPNKEVIVVDDGSSDGSLAIIESFKDRITYETGPNLGANVARNRLLELSRGDWLQYLDADDYLLPDKISAQMEFLSMHPRADVVFGPVTMEHFDEEEPRRELLAIPEPHDPWVLLARWYLPQTGASFWRKQAIADVGGWKADQPCCQEHELYLRLLIAGKPFAYCEYGGVIYRHWGENTLWRRNVPEVHRRRLEIEQRAEDFLHSTDVMTPQRQHAINMGRFETARIVWQYNRKFAKAIARKIHSTEPTFTPKGLAAPQGYQMAVRLFGFAAAETLADWRRQLFLRSTINQAGA